MVQVRHETAGQECTAPTDQRMQDGGEMQTVKEQDDTADFTVISTASMPQLHRTDMESCPEAQISMPVSQTTLLGIMVDGDGVRVDEKVAECNLNKGSKDKMNVAKAESTDSTKKSQTVSQRESYIMESNITQNRNSALVLNSFMEHVQGFAAGSVRHDTSKVETINSVENKDNNTETKKVDIEKMKKKQDESKEKKMGNETEQRGDSKGESTNFISEQGTEMSKYKKQPEIEGLETHLSLSVIEKTKIYTRVQPERHMVESRDQSVVSPIIILPDTRETVIKNVAKMRAMPFTPEIKVTVPEKVKHEELFSVPRIDALLSEPERVIDPLVHEDALIHRDNKPSSEEPMGIASRPPNRNTRDDSMMIIAEPLDVTPPQHEKNVNWFPSDQRAIEEVKPESLEAQMGDREEPYSVNSGWNRGNDSNRIPSISIACADDIALFQGQDEEYRKPVFHDTVHLDSTALKMQTDSSSFIPTTHVESSTENSIKKEIVPESLTVMLREVVGHFDSGASHNAYQVYEKAALQKEGTESRNLVETQLSSDVSSALSTKALQNTTACDTNVCPDKESKVEPDADRFQKDKPAMDKLGLTTPVGPTLPPLSPASLRRLMAKNNPNLETQGSTVTILGDGSEKKGEDSGGSTPTSILSCENSPKMKRRDSLTLIPSATPEELASGARRKIYLAKTKSEDEVSDIQSKRDSPYMSPSQARRAAFLQLQSGQQAQHMEKRSPLLGRRKTMLEMHKPKEEPLEETNMSNTEGKPAEKEKLDPYKGNKISNFMTVQRHLTILLRLQPSKIISYKK